MSKVTRHRLARGVKLAVEHVYAHMTTIASKLSNKSIAADNIKNNLAPFRVNLNIPAASFRHLWQTDATWGGTPDAFEHSRHFAIPVPLLPPQNLINTTGIIAEGDPVLVLDEVMLSFDQGGEPGFYPDPGTVNLTDPTSVPEDATLKLSVLAKTPLWMQREAGTDPDEEVFSASLPLEAFIGAARLNPSVWKALSRQVNPYKTMYVVVEGDKFGEVYGSSGNLVLPSLTVSLRFVHELVPHGTQMENQSSGTTTVADSVTVGVPAGDAPIAATGTSGVQTGMDVLDTKVGQRLRGGYQEDGWRPRVTHVVDDAVYDVIAVPMFSSFGADGVMTGWNVSNHPWYALGTTPNHNVWDERLIPISWPFEIHHVIACFNYGAPNGLTWEKTAGLTLNDRGLKPTSATFRHSIDVSIGSYVRHDHMAWQSVANKVLTQAQLTALTFDQIRVNNAQTMTDELFQHELAVVPLVGAAAPGRSVKNMSGTSIQQGPAIFVARGSTRSSARSSIAGGTAPTRGCEQILRVAWMVEDTAVALNTLPANHVFAGVGGNWVFILGRKTAVGEDFIMRM